MIGKIDGEFVHYIFNVDANPGLAWSGDHSWQQNHIIYGRMDIGVGIDEQAEIGSFSFELSPNPATDHLLLNFDLKKTSEVIISVRSIT